MQVILFIYGLAFFSLGLTIWLRYDPRSTLKLAQILWFLAGFGFLHGLKDWLDLWALSPSFPSYLQTASPCLLLFSFLCMFEFGRRLWLDSLVGQASEVIAFRVLSTWIYVPLLAVLGFISLHSEQPSLSLTIWSRYLPGFLGSTMAALGSFLYCRNRLHPEEASAGAVHHLFFWYLASLSFLIYGISAGLVTESSSPSLSSVLNVDGFGRTFGIPIQMVRALCAITLAGSIGGLLKLFSQEHEERLRNEVERSRISLELLHETKACLDATFRASSQGLVVLDHNGLVVFANDVALGLLDYPIGAIKGRSFYKMCHHIDMEGQPRTADHWLGYQGELERVDKDFFWRANGTWLPVSYQVAPQWRNGHAQGVIIAFTPLA